MCFRSEFIDFITLCVHYYTEPHEILSEPPRGVGWVALTGGTWILIYVKEGFSHPYIKGRQS